MESAAVFVVFIKSFVLFLSCAFLDARECDDYHGGSVV